jgi:hypothetical protein
VSWVARHHNESSGRMSGLPSLAVVTVEWRCGSTP